MLGALLTGGDFYLTRIRQAPREPLRSLVAASALALDLSVHQD